MPDAQLISLPIRRRGRAPSRVVGRPPASLDRHCPLRVDRRCLHGRRCHAACGEGLRICRQCAGRRLSDRAQRNRRNSTTAANSPLCSKAVRIAAASASVTTNIPGAWQRAPGPGRRADGTRAKCYSVASKIRIVIVPGIPTAKNGTAASWAATIPWRWRAWLASSPIVIIISTL